MDIIWAPWRMQYILGEKPMSCFLCEAATAGVCEDSLVLELTEHSMVIMNRYPYINGHLMVAPITHVSGLHELEPAAFDDLHRTLSKCVQRVGKAVNPQGINLGMNLGKAAGAGLDDHIHYHVIPRFIGDNNVFNVLGDIRVIPDDLLSSYRRYLPVF